MRRGDWFPAITLDQSSQGVVCGSAARVTWELVKNTNSWAPFQTCWVRNSGGMARQCFNKVLRRFCAQVREPLLRLTVSVVTSLSKERGRVMLSEMGSSNFNAHILLVISWLFDFESQIIIWLNTLAKSPGPAPRATSTVLSSTSPLSLSAYTLKISASIWVFCVLNCFGFTCWDFECPEVTTRSSRDGIIAYRI